MAYDANPLREETQQVSPNVLSPQAQQQQNQMQEDNVDLESPLVGGQGATIAPGQAEGSQPASQPRKDKPRSGMGANLRQYIQANRPQTQRISQAATQNIGQQAQSIGNQVQKQKQAQQQQIQQNVQQREQAQQFAKNLLQQASQTGQIGATDVTRFRNLAQGKETFDAVDDLDLTRQEIDAQRLQQTAEAAATARGQADILRDTFSRQGRQYTRGQAGLDRLLLAGDETARQQVQAGAQTGAQQTAQGLEQARKTALERLSELRSQNETFAQDLQSGAMGQKQAVASEIDAELERQRRDRQSRLSRIQQEAQQIQNLVNTTTRLDESTINNRIADSVAKYLGNSSMVEDIRAGRSAGFAQDGRVLDAIAREALGPMANREALVALGYNPDDFGTFDAGYGTGNVNLFSGGGRKVLDIQNIRNLMNEIATKGQQFDSLQQASRQAGVDFGRFQRGEDLTAGSVASEEQRRKYDALRRLAGISDQDAQRYTTSAQNLTGSYDKIMDALRAQRGIERTVI